MYVCMQHHTLVDTSFNLYHLISELFHLKLGGSRCIVLSMHAGPAVMEGGGGGGRWGEEQQASCLVAKQAVEFPQVLASEL